MAAGVLLGTGREADDVPLDRLASDDDERADETDESLLSEPPIEPGTPSLENALFVLLGVLVALAVVARLAQLFG
jgi:hypothetical protein